MTLVRVFFYNACVTVCFRTLLLFALSTASFALSQNKRHSDIFEGRVHQLLPGSTPQKIHRFHDQLRLSRYFVNPRRRLDGLVHVTSMDIRSLKKKYSFLHTSTKTEANLPVLRPASRENQTLCAQEHKKEKRAPNMSSGSFQEDKLTRELTRGAPTDSSGTRAASGLNPSEEDAARKRSQYFEDSFSTREPHNTPKHRVNQDSVVIVEMKTNTRVRFILTREHKVVSPSVQVLTVESR